MTTDDQLELWVERYAELLGCDNRPGAVAVAIEEMWHTVDRQRVLIGRLRGQNAVLLQSDPAP